MGRKVVVGSEAAQIDDLRDPGGSRRLGEVDRGTAVEILEVSVATHRMDEVVGRVNAFEGAIERGAIEDVAREDLRLRRDSIPQQRPPGASGSAAVCPRPAIAAAAGRRRSRMRR